MVEIDSELQIGYGVALADMDGDGDLDIVLADKNQFVWYENPLWGKTHHGGEPYGAGFTFVLMPGTSMVMAKPRWRLELNGIRAKPAMKPRVVACIT